VRYAIARTLMIIGGIMSLIILACIVAALILGAYLLMKGA